MKDSEGNLVANPIRDVALTASTLRTGLYTSVMAFNVADLVIGLGLAIAVMGLAFGGIGVRFGALPIPAVARRLAAQPATAINGRSFRKPSERDGARPRAGRRSCFPPGFAATSPIRSSGLLGVSHPSPRRPPARGRAVQAPTVRAPATPRSRR